MQPGSEIKPEKSKKDIWEKADIILKPVGALITALTIACVGYLTQNYLSRSQDKEAKAKLYTELISKREDAESNLRKDMLNSIMANVLKSNDKDEERNIDEKILQLEMLTYNFHESLNLLPLFEYLDRQNNLYTKDEIARQLYKARLIKLAKNISSKQTSTLEAVAQSALFTYEDTLISYKLKPEYKTDSLYRAEIDALYENSLDAQVTSSTSSTNGYVFKDSVFNGSTYDRLNQIVRLKVVDYNYYSSTVKVRMSIQTQYIDNKTKPSAEFYVSYFEFPLIDNTRLENDMRLAIVLRNFEFDDGDEKEGLIPKVRIELKAIYFPGSKSGLKDKPYIDDIVSKLVKNRQN